MGRRTSSPCLLGFFTTIFFISFQGSLSEKPKVLGPPHPLCATLGEDTVLRCRLPPGVHREALEVRWFSSRFEAPIHRYRNGSEEQETQLEEYQGRSELLKEDLQDGTMSLRIRNVTALDGGKYQCRFMTEVFDGAAALELEVADYSACVLQRAVDRLQMKKKELQEEKHTLQLQKAWYYRTIQSAKNRKKICIGPDAKKAFVTLDPDTAGTYLHLTDDRRSVKTGRLQRLPFNPKRFAYPPAVMGSEGFQSGKHYWEMDVSDLDSYWTVGVTKESVNRMIVQSHKPEGGQWTLELWASQYYAGTSPGRTLLAMEMRPRKLGVYLDYEAGQVSFYNPQNMELFFTFTDSFREKVFPYFRLGLETKLVLL